jgi:nitrate/nitrite transporter NarK
LLRNARLSCVSHAFIAALFPIATLSLFLTHDLGLTVADVFLLQATFGFFVALLEVPSGYLADRIGYRITMVIGAVLGGASTTPTARPARSWPISRRPASRARTST